MDPNTALKNARAAAARLATFDDNSRGRARIDAEESLVEAFQALDEWLCNGGFLPADWCWAKRTRRDNPED